MKISFLVTYYNQKEYVRESIESILALRKPPEWELLVGDDGSEDGTAKFIETYIAQDPIHISLYVMPREKGVKYDSVRRASANRLNLLRHSTGDCFCVLDGDDYYCDEKFVTEAIDILQTHADVSVVSYGYKKFGAGKNDIDCLLTGEKSGYMDTENFISEKYLPSGTGVHRIDWKRLEKIEKEGWFDDSNILMNSLSFGRMYYIDRVVYAYRQTGESLYSSMSPIEQAVLNVQSYDIDNIITEGKYNKSLLKRYAGPIMILFYWRDRIGKELGDEKKERYLRNSELMEKSLSVDLLTYSFLTNEKRKNIKDLVRQLESSFPKYALKLRLERMLGMQPR